VPDTSSAGRSRAYPASFCKALVEIPFRCSAAFDDVSWRRWHFEVRVHVPVPSLFYSVADFRNSYEHHHVDEPAIMVGMSLP